MAKDAGLWTRVSSKDVDREVTRVEPQELKLEVDETRGFMKAIVDSETSQILGATVLGLEGGEIMSMLEIAMMGKLPYTALQNAIFAHPTLAESLNNLFNHFVE